MKALSGFVSDSAHVGRTIWNEFLDPESHDWVDSIAKKLKGKQKNVG